jgi:hypothetical protein
MKRNAAWWKAKAMQNAISLPAIDSVLAVRPGARDNYLVCDMSGFIAAAESVPQCERGSGGSWFGGKSYAESLENVRSGDLAGVADADKFLADMESHVFVSRQFRVFDDVVGAVPNIPAYLAGVPQNMRRRTRQPTSTAPLSVFVNLTSSAGIGAADLYKRGAAILALVRLLSNVRAVELWGFVGLGDSRTGNYVAVRLDTAPLDLARAAHVLTHTSVARGLGYGIATHRFNAGGAWPYSDVKLSRKHGAEILARVTYPGSDVLLIPPIFLTDDCVKNPVKWIRDMLQAYGGAPVDNAA